MRDVGLDRFPISKWWDDKKIPRRQDRYHVQMVHFLNFCLSICLDFRIFVETSFVIFLFAGYMVALQENRNQKCHCPRLNMTVLFWECLFDWFFTLTSQGSFFSQQRSGCGEKEFNRTHFYSSRKKIRSYQLTD